MTPHALPGFDEAIAALLATVEPDASIEALPLAQSVGRVLAEDVRADRDQPPFNRSAMDGYALRACDFAPTMPVAGDLPAGAPLTFDIPAGQCISIATGAVVPDELDTVVPHEDTDRGDPVRFRNEAISAWSNIHRRGADAAQHDVVLRAGTMLRAGEIGLAAAMGCPMIDVRRQPRVAVISSGDEIVGVDDTPEPHQIRSSNGEMISALVQRVGGAVVMQQHVADDQARTRQTLAQAVEQADIVVTSGGISAGTRDFLPAALEDLGCGWSVAGIRMQPGRPVRAGQVDGTTVVCLPGNPVSALVCATLVLASVIRTRDGRHGPPRWRPVTLDGDVRSNPHREVFRPAKRPGPTTAQVPSWQGSGDLCHITGTGGLVRLPASDSVPAGATVPWTRWP